MTGTRRTVMGKRPVDGRSADDNIAEDEAKDRRVMAVSVGVKYDMLLI